MQNNDNTSPQTPLTPTKLPKTAAKITKTNNIQNINIETNIWEKLKACVKTDTLDIFCEFLLENCKEENIADLQTNEKQRSSERKIQPLENEIQNVKRK